jgi:hypothetical protein
MFSLLFLPIKLALGLIFGILFLPYLLLRMAIKLLVALVVMPFVLVTALAGVLFAIVAISVFAVVIPLLPFALVALCVWLIVKASSRPAVQGF